MKPAQWAALGSLMLVGGPISGALAWMAARNLKAGRPRLAALCVVGMVATPFVLTGIASALLAL